MELEENKKVYSINNCITFPNETTTNELLNVEQKLGQDKEITGPV